MKEYVFIFVDEIYNTIDADLFFQYILTQLNLIEEQLQLIIARCGGTSVSIQSLQRQESNVDGSIKIIIPDTYLFSNELFVELINNFMDNI